MVLLGDDASILLRPPFGHVFSCRRTGRHSACNPERTAISSEHARRLSGKSCIPPKEALICHFRSKEAHFDGRGRHA